MPIKDETPWDIKETKMLFANFNRFSKHLDVTDIYFLLDMEDWMKIHSDIILGAIDNYIMIFKAKQDKKWLHLIHADSFPKS